MLQSRSDRPVVIAVGYRSGVGKDLVGDYLVETHGFVRVAFADIIKREAMSLYGLTEHEVYVDKDVALARLAGKTPRHYIQITGDQLRSSDGPDVVVEAVRSTIHALNKRGRDVVVTDLRMWSELRMLRDDNDINEVLWCIERKNVPNITKDDSSHVTETALADFTGWNDIIHNNGTISDLFMRVWLKLLQL
jgi:hypothetical protein